ncbi:ATP-binding protein [Methanobrevibacter curvatus]|uniref:Putative AAA-ATPase n=1 Tax=Methanobrevibacter curvatus TaxID=49547 RepID=A0A166B3J0_9EURY|nr:ATP-binding protein [Methanobrevibacter curvatus]KZX12819.1 putative AAA-ATPase [Methanobrevibacter curvatus]
MEDIRGRLSLGIAEFDTLIEKNKIYVDKTKFIAKMIDYGETYYFLSRPRRFGKTLFVSTLENFFKGKKELFKDTYIYNKFNTWEWKKYPVIRISMKQVSNESPDDFKKDLLRLIEKIGADNNLDLIEDASYVLKFSQLIEKLSKKNKNKVVVLIDEYDAPIIKNISSLKIADKNREILQEFYNVLKISEKYLEFVFFTGITKFTKTSIFSTINNLTELTLDNDYSTICGITHQELETYYHNHIQAISNENNESYENVLDKVNHFYDGYSWDGINRLFNPYSTLRALSQKEFSSFWYGTGTPSFLAEIFKHKKISTDYTSKTSLKATDLDAIDLLNIKETALLFQTGYLTIDKEFIKNDLVYFSLKIPNFEVEQAYKDNLTNMYIDELKEEFNILEKDMWDWIKNKECDKLAKKLRIKFARLPLNLKLSEQNPEKWKLYSAIFLAWLDEMGMEMNGEKTISHGIIDGVLVENDDHVAIIEIKYTENENKSLDSLINESFKQIYDKEYYLPFEDSNVSLIALAFKDRPIKNGTITDVKCKIKSWERKN